MWHLPDQNVPILCQCKCEQSVTGIQTIREFESVVRNEPAGTLGLIASDKGFSVPARRYAHRSAQPIILTRISRDKMDEFDMNNAVFTRVKDLVTGTRYVDGKPHLSILYKSTKLYDPVQ